MCTCIDIDTSSVGYSHKIELTEIVQFHEPVLCNTRKQGIRKCSQECLGSFPAYSSRCSKLFSEQLHCNLIGHNASIISLG